MTPLVRENRYSGLRHHAKVHSFRILTVALPLDKLLQEGRQVAHLISAASAQLARYGFRDVPRPTLCRVESDDANGTAVLAVQQIRDDGFETGSCGVGLAPCLPDPAAEFVEHKINVLVIARWHDRGGPIGPRH